MDSKAAMADGGQPPASILAYEERSVSESVPTTTDDDKLTPVWKYPFSLTASGSTPPPLFHYATYTAWFERRSHGSFDNNNASNKKVDYACMSVKKIRSGTCVAHAYVSGV